MRGWSLFGARFIYILMTMRRPHFVHAWGAQKREWFNHVWELDNAWHVCGFCSYSLVNRLIYESWLWSTCFACIERQKIGIVNILITIHEGSFNGIIIALFNVGFLQLPILKFSFNFSTSCIYSNYLLQ